MQRSQLTTACPGRLATVTTIAVDDAARFGVSNPANVGPCPLSINGLDENGNPCVLRGQQANLVLHPGDTVQWYTPPANAQTLVFAAFDQWYYGQGILEFDTPDT